MASSWFGSQRPTEVLVNPNRTSSEILAPLLPGHSGIPCPQRSTSASSSRRGSARVCEPGPIVTAEETDTLRCAFLRHLYNNRYEEPSAVGATVRAVHKNYHLSFWVLSRGRTDAWPALFAKWGIDGAPLLEAWEEWQGDSG